MPHKHQTVRNIKKFYVMIYKDREDAAMKLIPLLEKYKNEHGLIIAFPIGGVPIGYYIAKVMNLPLELILTKKIGHPQSSDLAVGAVNHEGRVLDHHYNPPQEYFDNETIRIRKILKERYKQYIGERSPVDFKNKTVIIVDDGIAKGYTLMASIQMMRTKHPNKIVIAVPVVPPETARRISELVDNFICPLRPANFAGVG